MLHLHAIRYLRPGQVFWRAWRKLPAFRAPDGGPAPACLESGLVNEMKIIADKMGIDIHEVNRAMPEWGPRRRIRA